MESNDNASELKDSIGEVLATIAPINVPPVHTQRASPFVTLRPGGQPIRRESG